MSVTSTPIVLVEDDARYIEAVQAALQQAPGYYVSEVFRSVEACQQAVVSSASIWLIDLGLPGPASGLDLITPLVGHGARVLVMTVFEDEARVVRAIQAGAHGYFVKGDGDLLRAVDEVKAGQAPLSPRVATHLLRLLRDRAAAPPSENVFSSDLSPRELETLQALAHGYSYREIAARHRVSYHTVGDHIKSIYRKLQVNSKTAAINAALKRGILSLHEV